MNYLFLDDIRMPSEVGNYIYPVELRSMYRLNSWIIVRNYKQFVEYLENSLLPDVISFDHDLSDFYNGSHKEKTGLDCAKYLCELLEGRPLPHTYIHSMNPIGADNIKNYLNNYEKSRTIF